MQRLPVKDDNLRLILSKGHEKWFDNEIRDRFIAIGVLILLFLASGAWLLNEAMTHEEPPKTVYVDEDETAEVIKSYEDDGFTVIKGQETGQQPEAGGAVNITTVLMVATIVLILISPMFVCKALTEIIKLRQWRAEHHEFLASYNREAD